MCSQKDLYTIQQVSLELNIPKPTLRFWEKALDGIVVPLRTRGGQRRYTSEHIAIIEDVHHMKKRGLSLAEIRRRIHIKRKMTGDNPGFHEADVLVDRIAKVVRDEIYSFFQQ